MCTIIHINSDKNSECRRTERNVKKILEKWYLICSSCLLLFQIWASHLSASLLLGAAGLYNRLASFPFLILRGKEEAVFRKCGYLRRFTPGYCRIVTFSKAPLSQVKPSPQWDQQHHSCFPLLIFQSFYLKLSLLFLFYNNCCPLSFQTHFL